MAFLPERRGHGRTPDVDGPLTYENMASDTAAFIEALGIGPAHLVGWSDGASVALYVALHRPELVRKVICMGAPACDGYTPKTLAAVAEPFARRLSAEHDRGTPQPSRLTVPTTCRSSSRRSRPCGRPGRA